VNPIVRGKIAELRYCTWKHNPITAGIMKLLVRRRSKNLETLIFVATTGRSGTKSLYRIFASIEGCSAHHEPYPEMIGERVANRNRLDDPIARFMYNYIKSVNIRRYTNGAKYYFEANHLFIKSFCDYVFEDFSGKVKVIHLYRHPTKVANSIFALNNYPGTEEGNKWWLDYHSVNNILQMADILDHDKEFSHDFYKCLWYWYEIEARVCFWKTRYPQVQFYDFKTEDIDDRNKLISLIESLGLEFQKKKLLSFSKERINKQTNNKRKLPIPAREAYAMHNKFIRKIVEKGYNLPASIA